MKNTESAKNQIILPRLVQKKKGYIKPATIHKTTVKKLFWKLCSSGYFSRNLMA